ncbi:MAG: DUF1501 domain-containing protein, partial [Planctomycetota bacterium]|nr:DUF1501 domain-containing protein [Planctomycetota bacterium]
MNTEFQNTAPGSCFSRRHFLGSGAMSLGPIALASLLKKDGLAAAEVHTKPPLEKLEYDLRPKKSPKDPTAKAMISLFMGGGPSHLDLFDPKPLLEKYDGKTFPGTEEILYDNAGGASKEVMASPFKFQKYGKSGLEFSELVPWTAKIADDITVVRSMNLVNVRNHEGGMRAMTTGTNVQFRPNLGSWLSYGLGSETENLPAFVALVIGNNPPGSPFWNAGFLPSIYQGTHVREAEPRIMNLKPASHLAGKSQDLQLELLQKINRRHLAEHPGENDLQARIANYEVAARMQTAATEAFDLKKESEATRMLYGIHNAATKRMGEACLIARRLVERGVRYVQIWNYSWDLHENINAALPKLTMSTDQPSAAMVMDLKARGMLESTHVYWGGEMGRLPV